MSSNYKIVKNGLWVADPEFTFIESGPGLYEQINYSGNIYSYPDIGTQQLQDTIREVFTQPYEREINLHTGTWGLDEVESVITTTDNTEPIVIDLSNEEQINPNTVTSIQTIQYMTEEEMLNYLDTL